MAATSETTTQTSDSTATCSTSTPTAGTSPTASETSTPLRMRSTPSGRTEGIIMTSPPQHPNRCGHTTQHPDVDHPCPVTCTQLTGHHGPHRHITGGHAMTEWADENTPCWYGHPKAIATWTTQPAHNKIHLCEPCLTAWLNNAIEDPALAYAKLVAINAADAPLLRQKYEHQIDTIEAHLITTDR